MNFVRIFSILLFFVPFSFNSFGESKAELLKIFKAFRQKPDKLFVGICVSLSSYYASEDPDSSLLFAEEGLKAAKILKSNKLLADAYRNKGVSLYDLDRIPEAIDCYNLGLQNAQLASDTIGLIKMHINLANAYLYLADYKSSIENILVAQKMADMIEDKTLQSYVYNSTGAIYADMKDWDKAIVNYLKALDAERKIENTVQIVWTLNNIGNAYSSIEKIDKAILYYRKSIQLSTSNIYESKLPSTYSNLANLFRKNGQTDSAKKYVNLAFVLAQKMSDQSTMGHILANQGMINFEEKRYKASKNKFSQALLLSQITGEKSLEMKVYSMLSDVNDALGNHREAHFNFRRYFAIFDSIRSNEKTKEIGWMEGRFELEKQISEDQKKQEIMQRLKDEREKRSANLQYLSMVAGVILFFLILMFLVRLHIGVKVLEGLIFFAFLILFELVLVFSDPYVEQVTGSTPVYKWLFNSLLALLIFQLHSFMENSLKRRLSKA